MSKERQPTDFTINENALNRISQSATQIYSMLIGRMFDNFETVYYDKAAPKFYNDNTNNLEETIESLIYYSTKKAIELETAIQSQIVHNEIGVDKNMIRRYTEDGELKKYDLPNQLIELSNKKTDNCMTRKCHTSKTIKAK